MPGKWEQLLEPEGWKFVFGVALGAAFVWVAVTRDLPRLEGDLLRTKEQVAVNTTDIAVVKTDISTIKQDTRDIKNMLQALGRP